MTTCEFLDFLFTGLASTPDQYVEVRALRLGSQEHPRRGWWPARPSGTLSAARTAALWSKDRDVYFGVLPRNEKGKGGSLNCTAAQCLFVDIDHATTIPKSVPTPHLSVLSGGGIHAYWMLSEAVDISSPKMRSFYLDVLERLCKLAGADISCRDTARILRLPGTINHKYDPAVAVTGELVSNSPPVHIDWWNSFLPETPRKKYLAPRRNLEPGEIPKWLVDQISLPSPDGHFNQNVKRLTVRLRSLGIDMNMRQTLLEHHASVSGKNDQTHINELTRLNRWAERMVQPEC